MRGTDQFVTRLAGDPMNSHDKNKTEAAPKTPISTNRRFSIIAIRVRKLEIQATKPLGNQRDLALAYTPVAAPCLAIKDDPPQRIIIPPAPIWWP